MRHFVTLSETQNLPRWRRPVALLVLMAAALPFAHSTWMALLNNFVIEEAGFNGSDIGWLQSVREIPGLAAIGVMGLLVFIREQRLGLLMIMLSGLATAVVAWFPSFEGLLLTTMLSSLGFHYYETVNQSLQLQWIDKANAPRILGWIIAAGSAASLVVYVLLVIFWQTMELSFNFVYMTGGMTAVFIAAIGYLAYPQFKSHTKQHTKLILRKRYWLYYALQFMSGARRQIFIVFAAFMMVERFGFAVHEVTALFLINFTANMIFAPLMGGFVQRFGERRALLVEYIGLMLVFLAYGGIYLFGWGAVLAAALYIIDHLFFALAFALKTYFQKIADPADIAPTAAVAFSINHIAAVVLPALLGYMWLWSPMAVFITAVAMAAVSLGLSLMIPRHPEKGYETIFARVVK